MFKEPLRKQIEAKGVGLGLEDNGIQGPVHLCHVGIWADRTCCSTVFCFVLRSWKSELSNIGNYFKFRKHCTGQG